MGRIAKVTITAEQRAAGIAVLEAKDKAQAAPFGSIQHYHAMNAETQAQKALRLLCVDEDELYRDDYTTEGNKNRVLAQLRREREKKGAIEEAS